MESARPLRDVFADLAGHEGAAQDASDPRAFLAEHQALPDDLLVTAMGSYAGTAPAEVAEHLTPIVTSSSMMTTENGHDAGVGAVNGLNLLASAPVGTWDGEVPLEHEAEDATADATDLDGLGEHGGLGEYEHLADLGGLSNADSLDGDETSTVGGEHHAALAPDLDSDHGFFDVVDHEGSGDAQFDDAQFNNAHLTDTHVADVQFDDEHEHVDTLSDVHPMEDDQVTGSDYHVEHHLDDSGSDLLDGLDHDGGGLADLGDFHG
jgi:hypothetical protein